MPERRDMVPSMNIRDPRWGKTIHLLMVVFFSLWIGQFSTRDSHSTLSWVTCVLFAVALAGALSLLLWDIWKPAK
jgi:hypothetical protein